MFDECADIFTEIRIQKRARNSDSKTRTEFRVKNAQGIQIQKRAQNSDLPNIRTKFRRTKCFEYAELINQKQNFREKFVEFLVIESKSVIRALLQFLEKELKLRMGC
jgi:hypothetical protein